ncbi:MAG TPA: hypothetical protein VFP96_05400 [Candidatus Acidoferrum sp.]|nr:hypothetical protein [Candidatus Acidoferrum sp.]
MRIFAEDVMNCCNHTARRWQDENAFVQAATDLETVTANMQSIIKTVDEPTPKRAATVLHYQATASVNLSGIIGLIEKELRSE